MHCLKALLETEESLIECINTLNRGWGNPYKATTAMERKGATMAGTINITAEKGRASFIAFTVRDGDALVKAPLNSAKRFCEAFLCPPAFLVTEDEEPSYLHFGEFKTEGDAERFYAKCSFSVENGGFGLSFEDDENPLNALCNALIALAEFAKEMEYLDAKYCDQAVYVLEGSKVTANPATNNTTIKEEETMKENKSNMDNKAMETVFTFAARVKSVKDSMLHNALDFADRVTVDAKRDMKEATADSRDRYLAQLLANFNDRVNGLKDVNVEAWVRIKSLVAVNGFIRTCEIRQILKESRKSIIGFGDPMKEAEYEEAGKAVQLAFAKIRKWIRRSTYKLEEALGVNIEGTLANKVYAILKHICMGAKVIAAAAIFVVEYALAGIFSFCISVGTTIFAGFSWVYLWIKGMINARSFKGDKDTFGVLNEDDDDDYDPDFDPDFPEPDTKAQDEWDEIKAREARARARRA